MAVRPVVFEVRLSLSDLRRALFVWQFRKPWTYFLLGLGSVILLASLVNYLRTGMLPSAGLTVGLIWILLPFVMPFVATRQAARSPEGLTNTAYTIDEEGVHRTTGGTHVDLAWSTLYGWRDTTQALLVLTNKNCCFVIPKKQLSSDALASLQRALGDHLNKR